MTSASAAPTTALSATPEERTALRLLARLLVRAYVAERPDATSMTMSAPGREPGPPDLDAPPSREAD